MNSLMIKVMVIILGFVALITGLMVLEMNQLAPIFKQTGQLIFYVATVFFALSVSVLITSILFYRNRRNPKITVKRAKLQYAGYTAAIAALLFILPNLLLKQSAASCIKPNIYAVVSDPLNIKVCMNIKSILVAKILPFMTPLFIPNLIVSTLVIIIIAVLMYLLTTAKFIYHKGS